MRSTKTALTVALVIAAVASPAAADYLVKEINSFHIGGRTETLTGLATREIVFTAGAPPVKVDPNGEFEVEQMYVQYVKLAQPKAKVAILLWHGGGLTGVTWETKPDGKAGWQQFSSTPAMTPTFRTRSSAAAHPGRATRKSSRASRFSGPRKKLGNCFALAQLTRSAVSVLHMKAHNSQSRRSISSASRACLAGQLTMPRPKKPMTPMSRGSARASSSCIARVAISDSMPR